MQQIERMLDDPLGIAVIVCLAFGLLTILCAVVDFALVGYKDSK